MRSITVAALALILLLGAAVPIGAQPLDDRAGFWTWLTLRSDFPFGDFREALTSNGHNFTAMTCFKAPTGATRPDCGSANLAQLTARRTRRLNADGVVPIVYIFNRWLEPWRDEWWRSHRGELSATDRAWIERLSVATRGLDLIWSPCLEPRPEQAEWVANVLRAIRAADPRPVAHNGTFHVRGFDYYEAGTPGVVAAFHNGDHHRTWLRQFNVARQRQLIEGLDASLGALMVTQMELDGEDWCLPGWGNTAEIATDSISYFDRYLVRGEVTEFSGSSCNIVANWDESWAAMGERISGPPDPGPGPEPIPAEVRCLMNRLGWKWDQGLTPRALRGRRKTYVNSSTAQEAERRLLAPVVCLP